LSRFKTTFLRSLWLLAFVCLQLSISFASDLRVRGQVKGLTSHDRKSKPVVLSHVNIAVAIEGEVVNAKTNLAGVYIIDLKRNERYLMTVSRKGYHSKSIWISTVNLPIRTNNELVELTDFDFLLLKKEIFPDDISSKEDMGQLVFNVKKNAFQLNVNADYRQGKESHDHSLKLLRKTITYVEEAEEGPNQNKNQEKSTSSTSGNRSEDSKGLGSSVESIVVKKDLQQLLSTEMEIENSLADVKKRRGQLDSAKVSLDVLRINARTREDSLIIQGLEALLKAAENDLELAEYTIDAQKNQISMQKKLISVYILSSVLLLIIAGIIFWFYRSKTKSNKELAEKNNLILEGINYANTIQNSFLKTEEEIQKILPEFVLLFRPRDIVSGDIYWVSQVDRKTVIAAIDCTGHGVPGAFISMIANTLLNSIVNNRKILDPGRILDELHKGVMEVLQQDAGGKQAQDGMDLALIVVDESLNKMQYAGAKNHMYRIHNKNLEVIKADINSIGGRALRTKDGFKKQFVTKEVTFDAESVYYLFSDGFMDQFGGNENKKFNLHNFAEMLQRCATLDFEAQKKLLQESFNTWMGQNQQLDDVLVMGIKFKR